MCSRQHDDHHWDAQVGMTGKRALWLVLVVGALLHALVAFPNHYLFRTYALDLGLYTHTAWHYLHGGVHDSSLFQTVAAPMLADHFDLLLVLFSPLLLLFGTWTLSLVQWASILAGALGVRSFLLGYGTSERIAFGGMAVFLCFFGVFAASAFDYHSNVVATMALPWFLSALIQGKRIRAIMLYTFMVIAKENMGLWIGMVAWVFSFDAGVPIAMRSFTRVLGVVAWSWSAVVILYVMPTMAIDGQYAHFDYPLVSGFFGPADGDLRTPITALLQGLFIDTTGAKDGTAIKFEFWFILLLSGGWALFVRPRWGLMVLPLIAQKMWHNEPAKWAVFGQYSIEFAPLVAIAVALVIARWTRGKNRAWVLYLASLITACCTVRTMDNTIAFHDKSRMRFYQAAHYSRSYDTELVRSVIDTIPTHLVVSAQSPAVPHLALREHVYQFPLVREADLVLLLPQEDSYPLDSTTYRFKVDSLIGSSSWMVLHRDTSLVLLGRTPQAR